MVSTFDQDSHLTPGADPRKTGASGPNAAVEQETVAATAPNAVSPLTFAAVCKALDLTGDHLGVRKVYRAVRGGLALSDGNALFLVTGKQAAKAQAAIDAPGSNWSEHVNIDRVVSIETHLTLSKTAFVWTAREWATESIPARLFLADGWLLPVQSRYVAVLDRASFRLNTTNHVVTAIYDGHCIAWIMPVNAAGNLDSDLSVIRECLTYQPTIVGGDFR